MKLEVTEGRVQGPDADIRGCNQPSSIATLIRILKENYANRLTAALQIPGRPGIHEALPGDLNPRLHRALQRRGIEQLYRHQHQAWTCARAGKHTVIVTPTASGKTLCYNLPVLQATLETRAKALYLFPTKALSHDQRAELDVLNQAGDLGVRTFTFDGDTPGDARKAVRSRGDIVITNPDMLHQGILPHHTKWAPFFDCLRYVVIDEIHTYRGVFGAHMANVLRRLERISRFYGVEPVFILCSATIANPNELATKLIGHPVETISESGAPQAEKHLIFWNPPVVNWELGIRASARSETARIARHAMHQGLRTIVFAQSRLLVEVLTKYLKDTFDRDPRRPARVKAYRGGYLPRERRATEVQLRQGQIDCVVATIALELGVDIGALDVCLLNGYPGTIAGTWQRLGRAGRRDRASLGVMVATSAPLDQYIVRHPEFFLHASPEHARIDREQLLILLDHIRCAAFELPFRDGEDFGIPHLPQFLEYLEEEQVLHHEGNTWYWMADGYPANSVNLRSVTEGNFVVVDTTHGRKDVIAEVDYTSAPMTLHEGAIYMVQAQPWQVERLDWVGRKAFVRETRANYYTTTIDYTRLKILEEFRATQPQQRGRCVYGEVHLVRRVVGYKKIRYYTHENVGYGDVKLPDQELHTTAVWWQLGPQALTSGFRARSQMRDGFLGAAHAIHAVAMLLTMCERQDLGHAVGSRDSDAFVALDATAASDLQHLRAEARISNAPDLHLRAALFLYDNYPGGIGLADALFDLRQRVISAAYQLISDCGCAQGCPACIGPVLASDEQPPESAKDASLAVLKQLAEC